MSRSQKEFIASGVTARLFEVIGQMTDTQKKELLVLIGAEQRQYVRLPYLMQVTWEAGGETFKDFILDISPGGVFLETVHPIFVGQSIKMEFKFKGAEGPVCLTGTVVWIGASGAGISFSFESREQKQVVSEYILGLA